MIDEETTTSPPPPPRTGEPRSARELRRSRDNRVIAGVAAGLGRYFDIDPVIVRIGFVVLAVFGGSGILLYLIAWLVIAQEGEADSAAGRALKGSDRPRSRGVVAVLLILAAIFILGGPFLWLADLSFGGEGLFFPLLLIAAGVALLLWPDDGSWSGMRVRSYEESTGRSTADGTTQTPTEESSHSTALVPRPSDELAEYSHLPPPPVDHEAPPPAHGESDPTQPFEPEPPERARSFPVTSLTMAALLVMTGTAVLLDRLDVINLQPAPFLAAALVVIGLGLILAAFVGRAVGLIILGLVVLQFLWIAAVVDIEWWSGVGEERVFVDELDELEPTYHHGIGELVVDLADLDLDGETVDVEVGLTIGQVTVIVPPDTEIAIDANGGIGQVVIERPGLDQIDDGMDLEIDTILPGDNGTLNLDLDIGIGEARVEVAA